LANAGVDFADVHVELVFIDKTDGGNLLLLERGDDVRGHVRELLCGHGCAALAEGRQR